jgi:hypothetical protein
MTTARPVPGASRRPRGSLRTSLAVVVAALIGASLVPTAAASTVPAQSVSYLPSHWSNGFVECLFNTTTPGVTVSSAGSAGLGLWLGMAALSQAGLGGILSISASLSGANWTAENVSTSSALILAYQTTAPVRSALGVVGNATVSASFSLLEPEAAAGNLSDRVAVTLSISSWPWLVLGGPLDAEIALAAPSGGATHLAAGAGSPVSIDSVDNATGQTAVYFAGDANATMVNGTTGLLGTISVITSMVGLTASSAGLSVSFGPTANHARSVNYTSEVFVVPGIGGVVPVVKIPVTELLAAVGAAAAASLAIAGATRRVRRSPSDLEYVTEQEEQA